jgi:hypothetical protein
LAASIAGRSQGMRREELVELIANALERSTERLRTEGHKDPWPEDVRARDIVRLLRERSMQVRASLPG